MLHGDRLHKLRVKRNYTHEQLAKLLELGTRQVARYESGENDPSGAVISRIADIFQVTTDYLLGRTDDPSPAIAEDTLNAKERRIIGALRRGEPLEAIKAIVCTE